jgi:hypothetical protein
MIVAAEITRIKGLNKTERIKELGYDVFNKKLDLYEGEIGQLMESKVWIL